MVLYSDDRVVLCRCHGVNANTVKRRIEAGSRLQAGSRIQATGNHVLLTVETHRTMTSFMRSRPFMRSRL